MIKIIIGIAAFFLYFIVFSPAASAAALYEHREIKTPSRGITYEINRQMTTAGMLDVHVLIVPLDDPFIRVGPVDSKIELGYKETAKNLLSAAEAVAGVNGDFFGLAGAYSVPFGPVASERQLLAINASTNYHANEFASFYIDIFNNPFMRYMKAEILFFNDGRNNIEIASYNKVGADFEWPVIVDRLYMEDTGGIDARFPELTKIVVEGGEIAYISRQGETVRIPEDGYVLILPARMHGSHRSRFNAGEKASLEIKNNIGIDFKYMQAAIGGGGFILSKGAAVNDRGIAAAGRNPRTAVGISKDNKTMILMTVDGRSHSIGATHEEMAALLLKYGAYDAMHLDGGGSSTMVYRENGEYTVANTVSDGTQRRIINALGVFDRAPKGEMVRLTLGFPQNKIFAGAALRADVYGLDEYLHRLELEPGAVALLAEPGAGRWDGFNYIPGRTGEHSVQAWYGEYKTFNTLYVYEIAELQCASLSVKTLEGERVPLGFSGVATDGTHVNIGGGVSVRVFPASLGSFDDGYFNALNAGSGYLECFLNDVFTYVPLSVGGYPLALAMDNAVFAGYPDTVTGGVFNTVVNGRDQIGFHYSFLASRETQAAYMAFEKPIVIAGRPIALRLRVMGDGSGHWLRGWVSDAGGQRFTVDFARNADFTGWHTVTAMLPPSASAPFKLERIYMVETSSHEITDNIIYFSDLQALYAPEGTADIPQGTRFHDRLRADPAFTGVPGGSAYELTLPQKGMRLNYSSQNMGSMAVLNMTAAGGGLFAADKQQWASFVPDMERLNPKYVVIVMNENPLAFSQPKEFELFHKALAVQREKGRLVFVVSAAGDALVLTMKDGVRYIDMAQKPFEPAVIRFWTEGDYIWWSP